jgi:hypothetical protein
MEGKKTFLLYTDMIAVFEELSDEQAGQLIKHIMKYVNDKEPVLTDQLLKVAFAPIKNVLKKDLDVWKKTCERNKENGSKGGRPPKTETVIEEPKKPSGLIGNPKNPNEPDKMKKIDYAKLNRSNNDIWLNIHEALKDKNYPALEANLKRLFSLQKYYLDLLNFQNIENAQLKDNMASVQNSLNDYEKEWISEVAKRQGIYEDLKDRITKTFIEKHYETKTDRNEI